MPQGRASTVTLLFTDLVNSTALLQRAGDEQAQRVFQAHHKLLKEAVAANGGHAVKWLGDGLMVAFPSAADAVRCAVAMQQAARRPVVGERLAIRVGLHAGEALREETDYFGMPVVIARRLCEHATGGQILCSTVLSGLLASRTAFTFRDCGVMELKGLALSTCEVLYEQDAPTALLTHTPFVGRAKELERLHQKLQDVRAGRGGLLLLAGEPGIGKTRTAGEFAERARYAGVVVLWGRCYEGEWAPPYGPFAEAIATYGATADPDGLRDDLGLGAGPLLRLVPALRERLPDIPEPATLQPHEERLRLLDAFSEFLIALCARAPVLLVLDDLHWVDKAAVALLRHVARFAPRHCLLVLGAYRDVEVDGTGAFAEALRALPRETRYEHLQLEGLDTHEVEQLLEMIADHDVPDAFVTALRAETSGNPFFIREVLLQLVSENKIVHQEGRWTSTLSIDDMRVPESVRQVIGRRLSRLSADAHRFLSAAAAFNGLFRFDIAAAVAGLDEAHGLSAADEALAAQMLRLGGAPDTYEFVHALIRHTLSAQLSPSRQVRLHRQIAEAMERFYGDPSTGSGQDRMVEHAAEVAYQYHRSAALPGAERGVAHALAAADRAEAAYAHDDAVTFLRMALELAPQNDARRPRVLGRLGMALSWALNFDEALPAMRIAGDLIAAAEGADAAADYLAGAAMGLWGAGFQRGAWALASQGLSYIGDRRDISWVRLIANDITRREAEDPRHAGVMVDTPERRAMVEITERLTFRRSEGMLLAVSGFLAAKSRQDILGRFHDCPFWLMMGAGEYRHSLPLWESLVAQSQREGRIADIVAYSAQLARCHTALGAAAAARAAYDRGAALAARLTGSFFQTRNLTAARYNMQTVVDEGWEDFVRESQTSHQQPLVENNWFQATACAMGAKAYARLGRAEDALGLLATLLPRLERAPGWAVHYTFMACEAATTLWLLQRTDHIDVIEPKLREKVLVPDFRQPMVDARLSMAYLCALQGRYEEAVEWFAQARSVLDEQGARPLRAIVDFDEAVMYHRRAAAGDTERMRSLLDVALQQFRALEMTGWVRRAEHLVQNGRQPVLRQSPEEAVQSKGPSRRDPRRLAYELGSAFAERLQFEELLPFAAGACRELLDAEGVGVLFLDRQRNELYFPYVADEDPAVAARLLEVRFPADRGVAGTALRLGTALRIDDVSTDPRFFGGVDEQTRRITRALLCAPFTSPRGVSGVIEVVNPCSGEAFSDDDLALLDALAQGLANVLDNVENTGQHAVNGDDEPPNRDRGHAGAGAVFRRDGDYWTLAFGGRMARLKNAKGLHYIAHLLRHPGREFHARDLVALVGDPAGNVAQRSLCMGDGQLVPRADLGNAGVLLDAHAKADYKRRLDDLREELAEAERFNDPGRVSRAREEMEFITNQLAAAIGLGGRDRTTASDAERARLAVTKRIKAAFVKIAQANPGLARHLTAAITTGYFCCYAPAGETLTSWLVG
jgi:tetratricopeptide (TPR) repeat protein